MRRMILKIVIVCFLAFFVSFRGANAQVKIKSDQLGDIFKPDPKPHYEKYLQGSKNELDATFSLLFLGYKTFFSSQDMDMCVFHPSCSVYAIETLKTDKLPFSLFKVIDRLHRCHPFVGVNQYKIHSKKRRYYDTVH